VKAGLMQTGDIVFSTSWSPFAMAIRLRTGGWREVFRQRIPHHVGIVYYPEHGKPRVAEMLKRLRSSTPEIYGHRSRMGDRIHSIWRPQLTSADKGALNAVIRANVTKGVDYDWAELYLDYFTRSGKVPFLTDDEDKTYCSAYVYGVLKMTGCIDSETFDERVSPVDLWSWCQMECKSMTREVMT